MSEIKLKEIFSHALEIPMSEIVDGLEYNHAKNWDSIGHMALVAAIDDAFNVMLDTEDIINMSSFRKAREILEKYGVAFTHETTEG